MLTTVATRSTTLAIDNPPEQENPNPSGNSTPTQEEIPTAPLDVTPISEYKSPNTDVGNEGQANEEREGAQTKEEKAEGSEGINREESAVSEEPQQEPGPETVDDKTDLDELAKKQGLMTDEEFQMRLEGVQLLDQDSTRVAEGLDLALPAEEKEEEQTVLTVEEIYQPGDEPGSENAMEKEEVGKPKVAKRKLDLKDDKHDRSAKPKHEPKRRLIRGVARKTKQSEDAPPVEISSEGDEETNEAGQEETQVPTEAITEKGAAHPSSSHTDPEERPTSGHPEDVSDIPSSEPVHEAHVEQ